LIMSRDQKSIKLILGIWEELPLFPLDFHQGRKNPDVGGLEINPELPENLGGFFIIVNLWQVGPN